VILRRLGGIAIRRDRNENVVAQMKRRFDERDELCLLIPLEGTRRYVPYLRSGFYHIAVTAGVPIALGFLDYGEKQAGIGGLIEPTGDVRRDMDGLRDFFDGRVGLYPECAGEVRLREEDA
jgi:1-acyl-sn-glycerol-3-phosphate acyltransferase